MPIVGCNRNSVILISGVRSTLKVCVCVVWGAVIVLRIACREAPHRWGPGGSGEGEAPGFLAF